MNGRGRRDKGKRGELEACEALKDVWPGLRRMYGQARQNSATPDIDGPGCPVHIEVKRQEKINVHRAMFQAIAASAYSSTDVTALEFGGLKPGETPTVRVTGKFRPPVIVHKRNRGEWLVTVRAVDLARLLSR
jgi:hypothetical protein